MPAPSRLCLNQGVVTAFPFCLEGGWSFVGDLIRWNWLTLSSFDRPSTLVSRGKQATPAGLCSTTWGASQLCLKNIFPFHSEGRTCHTAWAPPSLPDSIVLLGGGDGADGGEYAFDLADIVPALPGISKHIYQLLNNVVHFTLSCQTEEDFQWNTKYGMAAGYLMEKQL